MDRTHRNKILNSKFLISSLTLYWTHIDRTPSFFGNCLRSRKLWVLSTEPPLKMSGNAHGVSNHHTISYPESPDHSACQSFWAWCSPWACPDHNRRSCDREIDRDELADIDSRYDRLWVSKLATERWLVKFSVDETVSADCTMCLCLSRSPPKQNVIFINISHTAMLKKSIHKRIDQCTPQTMKKDKKKEVK